MVIDIVGVSDAKHDRYFRLVLVLQVSSVGEAGVDSP